MPYYRTRKQQGNHRRSAMDESRIPSLGLRRSAEDTSSDRILGRDGGGDSEFLHPHDFSDVFGGPPRSVLSRQYLAARAGGRSDTGGDEIFRPSGDGSPARGGRILPLFSIPGSRSRRSEGFYCDIFGSDDDRRLRSRSKVNSRSTNSSSVLSSEELSPFRPRISDDASVSAFSSNLRPINVPFRWGSSIRKEDAPASACNRKSYFEDQFGEKRYHEWRGGLGSGFSRQFPSPEAVSIEPSSSYRSLRVSAEDLDINSPSSVVSSVGGEGEDVDEEGEDVDEQGEEDEPLSSYFINISGDCGGRCGEDNDAIDEAIAWVKEKFQKPSPGRERSDGGFSATQGWPDEYGYSDRHGGHGSRQSEQVHDPDKLTAVMGGKRAPNAQMKTEWELLDEDVRLWSAGNVADIRQLLSTLHHILWPDSGWRPVPPASLVEKNQVKKVYQKARLCLHPDKLQQRGATTPQKYVSEKAFSMLQDAWAAFMSQDASPG